METGNGMTSVVYRESEREAVQKEVKNLILDINNYLNEIKSQDSSKAIEILFDIQKRLIPTMLSELEPRYNNFYRVKVLMEVSKFIKNTLDTIIKLKEFEYKEEIDVSHPKIQLLFAWFAETVVESIKEVGVDSDTLQNCVDVISNNLEGWEDKVNKKLKGVSLKTVREGVQNPLYKK